MYNFIPFVHRFAMHPCLSLIWLAQHATHQIGTVFLRGIQKYWKAIVLTSYTLSASICEMSEEFIFHSVKIAQRFLSLNFSQSLFYWRNAWKKPRRKLAQCNRSKSKLSSDGIFQSKQTITTFTPGRSAQIPDPIISQISHSHLIFYNYLFDSCLIFFFFKSVSYERKTDFID